MNLTVQTILTSIGEKIGTKLYNKAEIFGGVVLITMAVIL